MSSLRLYRPLLNRVLAQSPLLEALCTASGSRAFSHPAGPFQTLASGGGAAPGQNSITQLRSFHASPLTAASLQVQVPPLGESITDGAIAAILKQPGDSVEEDEPILQIETDKVTIDVRAPTAGTINAILVGLYIESCPPLPPPLLCFAARNRLPTHFSLSFLQVKEGETVIVGHVVASIEEGAAAGRAEGRAPAVDPPRDAMPPAAAATAAPAAAASPSGRQPMISFPRRRAGQAQRRRRRRRSSLFPGPGRRAWARLPRRAKS